MNPGVRSRVAGVGSQVSGDRFQVTGHRLAVAVVTAVVIALAGSLLYLAPGRVTAGNRPAAANSPVHHVSLPLFFEPNQGQTDAQVKFLARGSGYGLFLTSNEAVLSLKPSAVSPQPAGVSGKDLGRAVIRMRLEGANPSAQVTGAERLPGKSNYFIGNDSKKWRSSIPQFARINYEAIYPGVDLTYYGNQGQLEYDFRVAPGADPNQIALAFEGASARIDGGDLVLSTGQGDVRFHAPEIYQQSGNTKTPVTGSFRQLADNKIGFEIGLYDRNRALVIDPVLSYSTYLGGSGTESLTQIAIDSSSNMYVAASTTSADFPVTVGPALSTPPDVLIAKINAAGSALVYATYLGGNGLDLLAGIGVITGQDGVDVTVAGTTTSTDFPTTANAFQTTATGTHGFLTRLDAQGTFTNPLTTYSTYLAGDGTDNVTGLAVQGQNAFVTGITTSQNSADGFPSTTNAYQVCPFIPGNTCTVTSGPQQFFATKVNTLGLKEGSVVYSTYFGGYNPTNAQAIGGGIAVDTAGRFYFTGGTNMLGVTGPNSESPFPLLNAWQSCLNQPGITSGCVTSSNFDAILVKINPGQIGSASLVYSTYLGGANDDVGHAVAVDATPNAFVTGETLSTAWGVNSSTPPGGGIDAFVAKVTNPTGSNTIYPLTFFNFVGGNGTDIGQSIAVDSVQAAHLTGLTTSTNLQTSLQSYGGNTDAFVSLISSTSAAGNYVTYLGGGGFDRGTSIALDTNLDSSPTFIAGETLSGSFPTKNPFQANLNGGQDAFVSQIAASSSFSLDPDATKVNPDPASVGNQVTFTFVFNNDGPEPAANVLFSGKLPSSGFTFSSANSSPGGTCQNPVGSILNCTIGNVAKGAKATVTVVLIPTSGTTNLTVIPSLGWNFGSFTQFPASSVQVTDFKVSADPPSIHIKAGESASYVMTLTPLPTYANSISVSHSTLPSQSTGTFTSTSVTISGSTPATTTLNISTTARPAQSTSLFRGGALYATWLPIGGLSLLGLGIGARRRRWLAGTLLGLVAGLILLQAACGNSSSSTTSSGGTPAGTYNIQLTGSSGSVSHNFTVTLIVD